MPGPIKTERNNSGRSYGEEGQRLSTDESLGQLTTITLTVMIIH